MTLCQKEISDTLFSEEKPLFESSADEIAGLFAEMPVEEISERLSVSRALASRASTMFYEFPNKSTGYCALNGFTGEVFRALDIDSLPGEAISFAHDHLMIISSLYGLLLPRNIIKPYRFDFMVENPSSGTPMNKYWKLPLTVSFVKHMKKIEENEILDLLPGEASKCLDWKLIKAFAKVIKIDFKTLDSNGNLKTPSSGKLKELRGKMLRYILENKINSLKQLSNISSHDFAPMKDLHKPGIFSFLC
ncbi:MAG: YaaA family protein [Muribaculaceae bacterium]|nr:YaaA family protein [Muribaculaceae bacterium]